MSHARLALAGEKADFRPVLPLRFLSGLYGADVGTMTYAEQLKHPNWQRRRLQMLEAAGFACSECGADSKTLHVHHRRYIKGRKAWEYEDRDLGVLCEVCHEATHKAREAVDAELAGMCHLELAALHALLLGYRNEIVEQMHGPEFAGSRFIVDGDPYFNTMYRAGWIALAFANGELTDEEAARLDEFVSRYLVLRDGSFNRVMKFAERIQGAAMRLKLAQRCGARGDGNMEAL